MSATYKTIILLMILGVELALAFNSDRVASKEDHEHNRHVKRHTQDPNEIRAKRRHARPRQLSGDVLDEDILRIFEKPDNQKQKRQVSYYPYPAAYPQYSQSTVVPNGNQINNYYPQFLPFTAGGLPFPIFVPILICLNPQNQGVNITDRFSFPDDQEVIANNAANAANQNNNRFDEDNPPPRRPIYNPNNQVNTPTGITLDPIKPSRPNIRPPPPLIHSSEPQRPSSSNPPQNQLRPLNRPQNQGSQQYPPQSINNVEYQRPQSQAQLSPCLSAIVRCCPLKLNDNSLKTCFRESGCDRPFWGVQPCDLL